MAGRSTPVCPATATSSTIVEGETQLAVVLELMWQGVVGVEVVVGVAAAGGVALVGGAGGVGGVWRIN